MMSKEKQITPEWVGQRLQKFTGLEKVRVDRAQHPLDEEPGGLMLNATDTYWRHPDYPFWVNSRNIDLTLLQITDRDLTFKDFRDIMVVESVNDVYKYLCSIWKRTRHSVHDSLRKSLIETSKFM